MNVKLTGKLESIACILTSKYFKYKNAFQRLLHFYVMNVKFIGKLEFKACILTSKYFIETISCDYRVFNFLDTTCFFHISVYVYR